MPASDDSSTLPLDSYTPEARALLASAQNLADERKQPEVEPAHLLLRALQREPGVLEVVRRSGADPAEMLEATEAAVRKLPKSGGGVAYLSTALLDLLRRAQREAQRDKATATGLEHLLLALSQEIRGGAGEVLASFNLAPGVFRPHLGALRTAGREATGGIATAALSSGGGGAGGDDVIGRYTRDLIAVAKAGDPVIGRDTEVRRLLQILERRSKNHPLLVGEAGVGKGAVVRALALRIAAGEVPSNLVGARVLELETGALLAGSKLRGEVEDRLKALARAVAAERTRGETVLVIDGVADLLGQGTVGSGVGDVLRPMLGRGELRVIATTTPEGLRKLQDRDLGLARRFSVVPVEAATIAQTQEILRGTLTRFEAHHGVDIGEGAVIAAVRLAARYVQERVLPDSAVDLLDETAAQKRVEIEGIPADLDAVLRRVESLRAQRAGLVNDTDRASVDERSRIEAEIARLEPDLADRRAKLEARKGARAAEAALSAELSSLEAQLRDAKTTNPARAGELEYVVLPDLRRRLEAARGATGSGSTPERFVTEEDVARTLETWTGIPTQRMLEAEADKLLKMEDRLRRRVVGQDEAVGALARAVRRGRVGLRDPGKPIGSFLFLGPSGVGKTELAKALAAFLFDDEQALTRLDMSEFMERHMAQRLLGAPPGYVDSEQGGFLTEAVRRRPYSVLLFDEVEKAHSDVFNLLLQVLDDGRLTDGRGRVADFSNTVLIMTSNIGSTRILETDGKMFDSDEGRSAVRDVLLDELKKFFRPEFLNRVDDVIVFRPLRKPDLLGIVDIQLAKLGRLLESRRLSLRLSDAAKSRLVDLSYEPAYGARPLRRTILKELQDPLAEAILSAGYPDGSLIEVDVAGEGFAFRGPAAAGGEARA